MLPLLVIFIAWIALTGRLSAYPAPQSHGRIERRRHWWCRWRHRSWCGGNIRPAAGECSFTIDTIDAIDTPDARTAELAELQ
jgi:hypothetical protein